MTAWKEHDLVSLERPLPERGLLQGDIGTIVLVHRGETAYEVEFATMEGKSHDGGN